MMDIDPVYKLKKGNADKIKWEDVMGAEVMKKMYPDVSHLLGASKEIVMANAAKANIEPRKDTVKSGDIVTFKDTTATQMLNIESNNSSFGESKTGIFSSSKGRWHEHLTREEIYITQKITKTTSTILLKII